MKKRGTVVCTSNLQRWEKIRQADLCKRTGQLASMNLKAPGQGETLSQKIRKNNIKGLPVASTYKHTDVHTHTGIHTNTYTYIHTE